MSSGADTNDTVKITILASVNVLPLFLHRETAVNHLHFLSLCSLQWPIVTLFKDPTLNLLQNDVNIMYILNVSSYSKFHIVQNQQGRMFADKHTRLHKSY